MIKILQQFLKSLQLTFFKVSLENPRTKFLAEVLFVKAIIRVRYFTIL